LETNNYPASNAFKMVFLIIGALISRHKIYWLATFHFHNDSCDDEPVLGFMRGY